MLNIYPLSLFLLREQSLDIVIIFPNVGITDLDEFSLPQSDRGHEWNDSRSDSETDSVDLAKI